MALLDTFRASNPERFGWRDPPYEYERDRLPIDVLAGSPTLREQIESGMAAGAIARSWEPAVAEFDRVRRTFLAY